MDYWRLTPLTYYGFPVVENPISKEFAYQPAVETHVLFPADHYLVLRELVNRSNGTKFAPQDIEDFDIELEAEALSIYLGRCPHCGGYCNGRKHGYKVADRS